jgi:hypothetical protein
MFCLNLFVKENFMKKLGIVLSVLVTLTLIGCASSGGSSAAASGGDTEAYSVDLSTMVAYRMDGNNIASPSGATVRNVDPFTRNYDNLPIMFTDLPDVTMYQRVTIKAKYFNADGGEITQGDGNAMVSLFYDPSGDIFSDGSPNLLLKEFNVGGFSGLVSSDRGVRIRPSKNPAGILLQNSNANVKFLELTEVTFHN